MPKCPHCGLWRITDLIGTGKDTVTLDQQAWQRQEQLNENLAVQV